VLFELKMLAYELNACSERELWDVEASVTESEINLAMHVFCLQQHMKHWKCI